MQFDTWSFTEKLAFDEGVGKWIIGETDFDDNEKLKFVVKQHEKPNFFGIGAYGRITKLEIRLGNEVLANYDCCWEKKPTEEANQIYEQIVNAYN
jgi:hypothetical protein